MPSLVITKNTSGPSYEDWDDAKMRQDGQVFAGAAMFEEFRKAKLAKENKLPVPTVEDIVLATFAKCWKKSCSIWMRYDGDNPDSFAIIEPDSARAEESFQDPVTGLRVYNLKLDYCEVVTNGMTKGDPIQTVNGSKSKLTLKVNEDSVPGKSKNKTMNVTIPSDYTNFNDQYLTQMVVDIETPGVDDVDYLLSSLTFRRCL